MGVVMQDDNIAGGNLSIRWGAVVSAACLTRILIWLIPNDLKPADFVSLSSLIFLFYVISPQLLCLLHSLTRDMATNTLMAANAIISLVAFFLMIPDFSSDAQAAISLIFVPPIVLLITVPLHLVAWSLRGSPKHQKGAAE